LTDAFGFFNIDKPAGMTSHDVVAKIRRSLQLKKVGHAGTLDPMATGVLIVCVGGATRLSEYVMHAVKRYRARVQLGVTTDTYDAEGAVQQVRDATAIRREDVEAVLNSFLGDIQQVPPMYSAIKQGGRKLYDLARAGETVEREARAVRIEALEIIEWSPPQFTVDVVCSAGTYIRSLAYDVGEALGVGAHLAGLIRTASGAFRLESAIPLDDLLATADWRTHLIAPQTALRDWPVLQLDDAQCTDILHGRKILGDAAVGDGLALAYRSDGRLMAIVQADSGAWKPLKVFSIEQSA
jgi:tRNA pseudouridine55 synthase